jgi:hypothetical protein
MAIKMGLHVFVPLYGRRSLGFGLPEFSRILGRLLCLRFPLFLLRKLAKVHDFCHLCLPLNRELLIIHG